MQELELIRGNREQAVSKDLSRLQREAGKRAEMIRRVVREYNEIIREGAEHNLAKQMKKQREIERFVVEYARLHKAIKRIRRKMRLTA